MIRKFYFEVLNLNWSGTRYIMIKDYSLKSARKKGRKFFSNWLSSPISLIKSKNVKIKIMSENEVDLISLTTGLYYKDFTEYKVK
jgi:hypothetical protein